jgi:hypothetical protein
VNGNPENGTEVSTAASADREFLLNNYNNLHDAVWKCHNAYWVMTGIFIPIILSSGVLGLKQSQDSITVAILALILILLLTFWFLSSKFLESWNDVRIEQLEALEHHFAQGHHPVFYDEAKPEQKFLQYQLSYRKYYTRNFGTWTRVFPGKKASFTRLNAYLYGFLVVGVLLVMMRSIYIADSL